MFTISILLSLLSLTPSAILCTSTSSLPAAWAWLVPALAQPDERVALAPDPHVTSHTSRIGPSIEEGIRWSWAAVFCRTSGCHLSRTRRGRLRAKPPQCAEGCPRDLLLETLPGRHSPTALPTSSPVQVSGPSSSSDQQAAKTSDEQHAAALLKARLPRYFAQLGLSDDQRENVLAVQAEFDLAVQTIELEVERLERERNQRLAHVLSGSQREKLDKLIGRKSTSR